MYTLTIHLITQYVNEYYRLALVALFRYACLPTGRQALCLNLITYDLINVLTY